MDSIVVDDEKDFLSNLHEGILGHILSFLPTQEAIHTCILSKTWIPVWKFITTLRFDDTMQKQHFINFVNNTLLHLSNSTIPNFSLCLSHYQYDSSQISTWISFILEHRVQNLHIQYAADKVLFPSTSLFNCNSLVKLVLQMRTTLTLPSHVCLSNLQYLNFSGIRLVSDSKDLITLSFPVLKVFEARVCEWSTIQNVSIDVPLLESFSITFWNSQSNESRKCSIKLNAPNLRNFSYEGDLEHEIVLSNPSSSLIRNASVVIVIDEDKSNRMHEICHQAHMLLRQIHQVQCLKLWFYKDPLQVRDVFTNLPAFERLTYLQLNEVTCEGLLNLLQKTPILKTLVLLHGVCKFDKDLLTSASIPQCFRSSLEVFQFGGFNVHEHELSLAKFVMKNAVMLERMTISTAFWLRYSDIDLDKVKEQIFSCPKCSSLALIEFSDVNGS